MNAADDQREPLRARRGYRSWIPGGLAPDPSRWNCEEQMADDLSKKGPADRSRINLLEPYEVQYWADKFDVSKERLSEAVRKVGHSSDAVERELRKGP
jgi:Protein of unknown function (DUF3606)